MSDSSPRITSLDGLRGLAALGVVLYHLSLLAHPALSASTWAWMTQSPLKVLFPGTEAVLVFFVLSGLVVALPALRPGFSWRRYYPARLLRLYVPVLGALVFATILILVLPRDPSTMPEGSWMRDAQASEVTPAAFLAEASLLPESYDIDNVLWSLRWELFFSLLLPLFVWFALRCRRASIPLAVLAMLATVAGRLLEIDALVYFPVFLLGTIIAINVDAIRAFAERRDSHWLWPGVAVLSIALLLASWFARPLVAGGIEIADLLWGLAGIGAFGVVVVTIAWRRARTVLERPSAQWLGRISFSLYLVHAPILGTLGYLFGMERWWLTCVIGLPLSIVVGAVFHRWVERPSHDWARRAGDRAAGGKREPTA